MTDRYFEELKLEFAGSFNGGLQRRAQAKAKARRRPRARQSRAHYLN
jgi:hypothetical protein